LLKELCGSEFATKVFAVYHSGNIKNPDEFIKLVRGWLKGVKVSLK